MNRRTALFSAALLLTGCSGYLSHDVPSGQPALTDMQVEKFKQQFDAAPGPKLLVLLSPT